MMRSTMALVLALITGPLPLQAAEAFLCTFQTECYEDEACGPSEFALEVQLDEQSISTETGDWIIVAKKSEDALITIFAAAKGAEYLVSITPEAARLSGHLNTGPRAIQYLGTCEGAF
ncbi:hypothetical protein [Lentibacter sp. XHP0401]|jgi:hypothetical protein|uniref:hypothetical protein n=1 Tax=Lentibacter sp. XHP0401 TaxID=2984334 RepID=UPI0021E7ADB8|nr:hypothetical protein [Lentibacter sp. XHP0401]MCV2892377.1 hypothetical protein [Lentibacter sp. XHP0401]